MGRWGCGACRELARPAMLNDTKVNDSRLGKDARRCLSCRSTQRWTVLGQEVETQLKNLALPLSPPTSRPVKSAAERRTWQPLHHEDKPKVDLSFEPCKRPARHTSAKEIWQTRMVVGSNDLRDYQRWPKQRTRRGELRARSSSSHPEQSPGLQ